jgi:hypothetical protein
MGGEKAQLSGFFDAFLDIGFNKKISYLSLMTRLMIPNFLFYV